MDLTVHQTITIHQLKVGAISNSSILQIGTAGRMQMCSYIYNTGNFTGPAPKLTTPSESFIPLPPPQRLE